MDMPAPNEAVLSRKARILERLLSALPADAVIHDEAETRVYECDALTAYRCPPMVAVLPASTEEVSDVLRICHEEGVPVVPRGSGTSLAGGALPTADCVILGVARMSEVLEIDYPNRVIRVQSGRTNLSVTGAVEEDGFFYAPDPSSQLACAIAGNIAMNSGGAHCLKYGVTTNNLLGATVVLMDGTILELGGAHLDAGGLDLLGVVCGSEGQLGVVTEATLRILPKPEGARPLLMGFDSAEVAGACVADIIKAGVLPVAYIVVGRGYRVHRRGSSLAMAGLGGVAIVAGLLWPESAGGWSMAFGAGGSASACTDTCCPSVAVDATTGLTTASLPWSSVWTLAGGVLLMGAHAVNLHGCACFRRSHEPSTCGCPGHVAGG